MMKTWMLTLATLAIVVAGCSDSGSNRSQPTPSPDTAAPPVDEAAILHPSADALLASIDNQADPCQDFYRYACGTWLDQTDLPDDRSRYSRSFSSIGDANGPLIQEIIESAGSDPDSAAQEVRIAEYYGACMDIDTINARGLEPIEPLIQDIESISDLDDVMRVVGRLQTVGLTVLFGSSPSPDLSGLFIAYFGQPGFGLSERDAYFRKDDISVAVRESYLAYVAQVFELLGDSAESLQPLALEVLSLETELASGAWTPAELRNAVRQYNKVDLAGLIEIAPSLPWNAYLEAIEQPDLVELSVAQPEYYAQLEQVIPNTDIAILKNYLRFMVARGYASLLPTANSDANFDFYGGVLSGLKQQAPRSERCRNRVAGNLPDDVGQLFVEAHFSGASRDIALDLIEEVQSGFRNGLKELEWLDAETEAWIVDKSMEMINKVGYPDEWEDYSSLSLDRSAFFESTISIIEREYRRTFDDLGRRVDRQRWGISPTVVNAFYSPIANAITFPAGILQTPFFAADAPAAMNFGAIGFVMGHEVGHGFDDFGRIFDREGIPGLWWNDSAVAGFSEATQCVDELYGGYDAFPDIKVNAALTRGENIADMGGVRAAYAGYQQFRERSGLEDEVVGELTQEQLFFVSYAQVWCEIATEEAARNGARNDAHAPNRFRVLGPLSQFRPFAEAFSCEAGTPMNPPEVCRVW
ncbi:M13 family metallopeptidase [Marinobacter alexandrii]|uniref:M13 family metallopeptidase n=1 Tax=Marinobacter alexandrii TaxID=2570351 RepID=UPI0032992F6A